MNTHAIYCAEIRYPLKFLNWKQNKRKLYLCNHKHDVNYLWQNIEMEHSFNYSSLRSRKQITSLYESGNFTFTMTAHHYDFEKVENDWHWTCSKHYSRVVGNIPLLSAPLQMQNFENVCDAWAKCHKQSFPHHLMASFQKWMYVSNHEFTYTVFDLNWNYFHWKILIIYFDDVNIFDSKFSVKVFVS